MTCYAGADTARNAAARAMAQLVHCPAYPDTSRSAVCHFPLAASLAKHAASSLPPLLDPGLQRQLDAVSAFCHELEAHMSVHIASRLTCVRLSKSRQGRIADCGHCKISKSPYLVTCRCCRRLWGAFLRGAPLWQPSRTASRESQQQLHSMRCSCCWLPAVSPHSYVSVQLSAACHR